MQAGAWPLYGMLELWTANEVFQAKENIHFAMELEPSPWLLVGGNNRHRFVIPDGLMNDAMCEDMWRKLFILWATKTGIYEEDSESWCNCTFWSVS